MLLTWAAIVSFAAGPVPAGGEIQKARLDQGDDRLAIPVESYPDSLLPPGAVGLDLVPVRATDVTELLAAFDSGYGWIVLDTLQFTGPFNDAKAWAWREPDSMRLVLASQVPFHMLTFYAVWEERGGGFELVDEYREDPSEDALEETLELLDAGRVEEASLSISGVLYPDWYYNGGEMAVRFLRASRCEAERLASAGDFQGAVDAYTCAGDACEQCGLDSMWFLDAAGFEEHGSPVSLWLDDRDLLDILEHLACVASEAGETTLADSAIRAAASLPRY